MSESHLALWWVPAGRRPTTAEAEARVQHVREHGPTPWAFTLREHYSPPDLDGQPESSATAASMSTATGVT